MHLLYAATTSDIISGYCFGQSSNNLDREDLNEPYFTGFTEGVRVYHLLSALSWLPWLLKTIPLGIAEALFPIKDVVTQVQVSTDLLGTFTLFN